MKKPKTSTMVAAAALTLGLMAGGVGLTQAASTSTTNPMSGLVTAIATKFNLNASEVEQVFQEQHAQMEARHTQEYKEYLAQAVKDGKLSQDQADKILAKRQELETEREANRTAMEGKTDEERKAYMEEHRTEHKAELEQWAKDNNIPTEYLRFGFGKGKGPGHGHGEGEHGFRRNK